MPNTKENFVLTVVGGKGEAGEDKGSVAVDAAMNSYPTTFLRSPESRAEESPREFLTQRSLNCGNTENTSFEGKKIKRKHDHSTYHVGAVKPLLVILIRKR